MLKYLRMILDYSSDEELHFWENCNCSDEVIETQDFDNCTCQENENHIWRAVRKLEYWLSKPETQLFLEDETSND